ncbi:MAG TPA: cobalt-precorrin-6Y C(15)-methyltransferase [Methanospirillum sp.]|nr:cobalt-precorrin-6Y C(15)-methyltransferase [Methanospirillum sp.]
MRDILKRSNPIPFEWHPPMYTEHMIYNPPGTPPTGGPTKDEILAIAMQKLDLKPNEIFADIGCGTGKITMTAAPLVSLVHAIDIRDEAYRWTCEVVRTNAYSNVTVHRGNAVSILSSVRELDKAFVGGSRNLSGIITGLADLKVKRVVITAVLLETLNIALTTLQEYDMFDEVTLVQVSKSVPLAGGYMLKPLDPVYIITGGYS